jgi:hypothetical protein
MKSTILYQYEYGNTVNSFKNKTILQYHMKSINGLTNNSVGRIEELITYSMERIATGKRGAA